jgi:hypothetical protein
MKKGEYQYLARGQNVGHTRKTHSTNFVDNMVVIDVFCFISQGLIKN